MKKLFAILLILVSFGAYSQSYNPTGPGWKYTPKIQTDDLQVKTLFKLNGETIKFQSPTDGQVIQRVLKDGQHIWTNKTLSSFMYDSLKFNKLTGIISLYKNGFVAISDTLDGRYALIEDIPTVPTSIWELTGINRTGWEEGKLVKFDSSGNLVVGSTTGASGIGLADLHATAPILYNSTTGTFSFSGETDPNVYSWAKASTKPGYSWSEISSKPTFATVATTGSYTDLINKPAIPAAQVNSDWNATSGLPKILNKPGIIDTIYSTPDSQFPIDYLKYRKEGVDVNVTEIPKPNGLISGGYVTWVAGLNFSVSPSAYYINGRLYKTATSAISLSASDATYSRIDLIVVDTLNTVSVIPGVPAVSPQKPTPDPTSQIELTQILILANATEPGSVGQISGNLVYNENIEWTGSATGVTVNFGSTITAFNGTVSADVGTLTNNDVIKFTNGTTLSSTDFETLSFFIKLKTAHSTQYSLTAQLYNGTTAVSSEVVAAYNVSLTGSWQNVSIPLKSFSFTSSTFNAIQLKWKKSGTNTAYSGFYLDFVKLQAGVLQPIVQDSYEYWGIGVNNGAARLIKSREVLKLFGFDEGVEVSRIGNSIYFKADTTFLASLHALNDTAQAIRDDFPVITQDTLFTTIAISDETTALTTGTAKRTFRMPVGCTLTSVRASVNTAPVGSTLIFDINEGGTSILSTKLSIDASEKTSKTAASQAVISDSIIADDSEMSIDIDQVGSSTAGAGAKVILYYLKN